MWSNNHPFTIKMTPENLIGKGEYGAVYKVRDNKTGEILAAKIYKTPISEMTSI